MEDLSGQRLGRYLLTRLGGRGGMASVYEAHDPTLDCVVAVKVLTNAAGTKKLKAPRTRSDFRWATNEKDAQDFTCSLPAGGYRRYLTAKNREGVSSAQSNVRCLVVR